MTYARYAAEVTVQFHLGYAVGDKEIRTFTQPDANGCAGQPPLTLKTGERSAVVAFQQIIEADNPNLERVQTGLPITETVRVPTRPDQVFQKVETRELPYDASEYPPLAAPPEVDLSGDKAQEWGVREEPPDAPKLRRRRTPKGRQADVRV